MALDILKIIADETKIPEHKVRNTVELLDGGNTVPFIARYRKEVTGELDENQIREIEEKLKFRRNLEQRKTDIIRLIDEQGKLTGELREKIIQAVKPVELEDLYLPFRQKRKTRAGTAREKGLEPLANYLLSFPREGEPEKEGEKYISEHVPDAAAALQGAMDIVAEMVSEDIEVRRWVRDYTWRQGSLAVKARDPEKDSVYRMYYENYREPLNKMPSHRVLAVNRGEREAFLSVSLELDEEFVLNWLHQRFVGVGLTCEYVRKAVTDGYRRLVAPAIERELRSRLTERSEAHGITIFAKNLKSLLLQQPVAGKTVLGVDPAYRTGCKWAVIDPTGKLLEVGVVYPTPPHKKIVEAEQEFSRIVAEYGVQAIVIGNGTGSRETEQFVADLIKKLEKKNLSYTIVSEAGASVYSASPLAAKEFPDLDVAERSAVSIGRRVQDPLAELVKIPPKSVGVGQYQHDLPEKQLSEQLGKVVESAVNFVGVDLNTASAPLLSYVSGINSTVAGNIVSYRENSGEFINRSQLKQVPKLGPKTFEQCAGFLRIRSGDNPLDATAIHPESYRITVELIEDLGLKILDAGSKEFSQRLSRIKESSQELMETAQRLGAGVPTLKDIIDNLLRPGRDPREELPPPIFRTDVLTLNDLSPGMVLKGTVRNVTDFGAFVDIGVKGDGLVHISQMAEEFVRHPMDVVSVGEVVTVRILSVDKERGRVSLSMKN